MKYLKAELIFSKVALVGSVVIFILTKVVYDKYNYILILFAFLSVLAIAYWKQHIINEELKELSQPHKIDSSKNQGNSYHGDQLP